MSLTEAEALIANLATWQELRDPCENGHVEHDGAAHVGRTLVHTLAGGFGADWDLAEAEQFIRSATRIGPMSFPAQFLNSHVAVWSGGRMVAFDTRVLKP